MLNDSSTFVNGDNNKWMTIDAGINKDRRASTFELEGYRICTFSSAYLMKKSYSHYDRLQSKSLEHLLELDFGKKIIPNQDVLANLHVTRF
jgi:hypothetical protein